MYIWDQYICAYEEKNRKEYGVKNYIIDVKKVGILLRYNSVLAWYQIVWPDIWLIFRLAINNPPKALLMTCRSDSEI